MRPRTILAGVGVILAAGTTAIVGTGWIRSPASPAVMALAMPAATVEITRGPLRDTKTVTGTLGYGELITLRPSLTGASSMVTWIAPTGATVQRGEPLYALDQQPVILFYGSVPQHRTLRFDRGAAAPVWVELEQAAAAEMTAELTLESEQDRLADAQARVSDATARLADAQSPAPAIAEFVQLWGAVHAAEAKVGRVSELAAAQLTPAVDVATAQAALATTRAAFDAAVRTLLKDLSSAMLDAAAGKVAVAEAKAKLDEVRTTHANLDEGAPDDTDVRQIASNLAVLGYSGPLPDQVRAWERDAGLPVTGMVGPGNLIVASGPVHIADRKASVGQMLVANSTDAGAILDYSSTDKRVTVPLNVGDRDIAAPGHQATITLPDNATVTGKITEVGSVVTGGNIDVTLAIADQAALGTLEVASVDVEFVSSGRENVLSVPIAALLARGEGGFAVEVVSAGESTIVPVRTGLFADGRVEVSGDGIVEGTLVGVPR